MSYSRVIPRDLFSEANLLKCYGQLYLHLEILDLPDVDLNHAGGHFAVHQNWDDGSIFIANIGLSVRGYSPVLFRPLNSREPWPLYALIERDNFTKVDEIAVFDDSGNFTAEMLDFLKGPA